MSAPVLLSNDLDGVVEYMKSPRCKKIVIMVRLHSYDRHRLELTSWSTNRPEQVRQARLISTPDSLTQIQESVHPQAFQIFGVLGQVGDDLHATLEIRLMLSAGLYVRGSSRNQTSKLISANTVKPCEAQATISRGGVRGSRRRKD